MNEGKRELGDKRGLVNALRNSGILYDEIGDKQHARTAFEEALFISEEISDKKTAEMSLSYLKKIVADNT